MKQQKIPISPNATSSVSRALLGGTPFRLPLTPTLVGRGEEVRATMRKYMYDYAVPLALYSAKMYQ